MTRYLDFEQCKECGKWVEGDEYAIEDFRRNGCICDDCLRRLERENGER